MFDISLGEMAVIGAVALVVIGPERLPKVARTLGLLVGRAQRFAASVKADLDREISQTELAKLEAEMRSHGNDLRNTIHQPLADAKAALLAGPAEVSAPAAMNTPVDPPATPLPEPDQFALTAADQALQPAPAAAPVSHPAPQTSAPAHDERQLDLFETSTPSAPVSPARDRR
ncbi:sec-independent protein translocase protein TatB [Silvimonas terrae]|uniref:Sec-independent protein translocase protein TatB n=1 Tax=Silvimonas terrae TaxID=300266 RepID=A0A840RM11_9NEIS|nr:Sec-independent protein translocase protein TatB [Silvimonas terrae]MBB5193141.1 sec-independent protein translocase protein TatB [Silvimonas terrae]